MRNRPRSSSRRPSGRASPPPAAPSDAAIPGSLSPDNWGGLERVTYLGGNIPYKLKLRVVTGATAAGKPFSYTAAVIE